MKIEKFNKNRMMESIILYDKVFSKSPWNQNIDQDSIKNYFEKLLDMNKFLGYILLDDHENLIGVSLGYLKPWIDGYEYYIDQFFISDLLQKQGYGKNFIKLIIDDIKYMDISSILLTTEVDVPAYDFYLKNGFHDLKELKTLIREVR